MWRAGDWGDAGRAPGRETVVIGDMARAGELIREAVMSWPGVTSVPHRFGGIEYRYGRKETGHVHGDRLADLPLPRRLHDEVIAAAAPNRPTAPPTTTATTRGTSATNHTP